MQSAQFNGIDEQSLSLGCFDPKKSVMVVLVIRVIWLLMEIGSVIGEFFRNPQDMEDISKIDNRMDVVVWFIKPTNFLSFLSILVPMGFIYLTFLHYREVAFKTLRLASILYYTFYCLLIFTWVTLIFYYNKIRIPMAYEPAFEAMLILAFIFTTFEALFVQHYITVDVILVIAANYLLVIAYIYLLNANGITLYSQLDFYGSHATAMSNFGTLTLIVSIVTLFWYTVIRAKTRCRARYDAGYTLPPVYSPQGEI